MSDLPPEIARMVIQHNLDRAPSNWAEFKLRFKELRSLALVSRIFLHEAQTELFLHPFLGTLDAATEYLAVTKGRRTMALSMGIGSYQIGDARLSYKVDSLVTDSLRSLTLSGVTYDIDDLQELTSASSLLLESRAELTSGHFVDLTTLNLRSCTLKKRTDTDSLRLPLLSALTLTSIVFDHDRVPPNFLSPECLPSLATLSLQISSDCIVAITSAITSIASQITSLSVDSQALFALLHGPTTNFLAGFDKLAFLDLHQVSGVAAIVILTKIISPLRNLRFSIRDYTSWKYPAAVTRLQHYFEMDENEFLRTLASISFPERARDDSELRELKTTVVRLLLTPVEYHVPEEGFLDWCEAMRRREKVKVASLTTV